MDRLTKLLSHLDDITAVQVYSGVIYEIIHDCDILWLKEFYQESPNWLMNWNINNKKNTIAWSELSDNDKNKYLDNEIDNYFSKVI